jgi:hypothetical protein
MNARVGIAHNGCQFSGSEDWSILTHNKQFQNGKSKAIPVTDREGPYGCETSRLPHILDNRLTVGGDVVSLTRRPPFTPGRFLVLISVRG